MKHEGSVRQQLKQVKFRHQKKLIKLNFKKEPKQCRFNGLVSRPGFEVGVCLYGYPPEPDKGWVGRFCDENEPGGVEYARSCELFEPKQTLDEVKDQFDAFLRDSNLPEIAQEYPDIAALMWVLDMTGAELLEDEAEEEVFVSHLLVPIQLWTKALGKNATPVALEFPVDAESAPYIVTSSESIVWVPEALSGDLVRAAIRVGVKNLGMLYRDIVLEIAKVGTEKEWGNVHPLTVEGVQGALEHLRYYDLGDAELLAHPATMKKEDPNAWYRHPTLSEISVRAAAWLPPGIVVAVPLDRAFVGFVSLVGIGSVVSVVHNPSRGIAVAWDKATVQEFLASP